MQAMTIQEQLRRLIDDAGISRHRICRLTGIRTTNLSQFMQGKRGLSLEALDELGRVMGITLKADRALLKKLAEEAPRPGRRWPSKDEKDGE